MAMEMEMGMVVVAVGCEVCGWFGGQALLGIPEGDSRVQSVEMAGIGVVLASTGPPSDGAHTT